MDFTVQIQRIKQTLSNHAGDSKTFQGMADIRHMEKTIGLLAKEKARPSIVPAEDVAFELGPPSMPSLNMVLWTNQAELVDSQKIHIIGPDISETQEKKLPFGQVIMLFCPDDEDLNVFHVETAQFLSNRLPGYMVRMVPGRLWARISKELFNKGFELQMLGNILIHDYLQEFEPVKGAEIIFITSGNDYFEELKPVVAETKILSGKNQKLKAVGDGEFECDDLNCDTCPEKETCDSIRDIIILRRKEKGGRS